MTRKQTDTEPTSDTPSPEGNIAGSEQPRAEATSSAYTNSYEPFPGASFFHGGRHSDIVTAMGRRLEQEGCAPAGKHLGPDWTRAHQQAFAAWQRTLRPKDGGDVSGIPDETAWDRLRVPRVSPLPREA